MSTKLAVIAIWAEDVAANVHFYRDVLGLELLPHQGARPHFKVEDVYLTILKGSPVPARNAEPRRFPLFALSVDDLDGMLRRLERHRIDLPWGVERDDDGRWVMVRDPAGNLIELVQCNG